MPKKRELNYLDLNEVPQWQKVLFIIGYQVVREYKLKDPSLNVQDQLD